ncbi:hypothetical protein ACTGVQ_07885 [Streptococcus suis]
MRKMNKSIIKYTTTITDNLYYLLPLELLLGFLWGISWGSLWIILNKNQKQTSQVFLNHCLLTIGFKIDQSNSRITS